MALESSNHTGGRSGAKAIRHYDDSSEVRKDHADLKTESFKGLEVFATGTWNGDQYSETDLDQMVAAFGEVGFEPIIKAGHQDGQEDGKVAKRLFGEPALGYVERIYRKGNKLYADLKDIPKRFASLIRAGTYKRVSSEIYWNYKCGEKTYPRVFKGLAFLGADIPALTNLKSIESLFELDESGCLKAYDSDENEFRLYDHEPVPPAEKTADADKKDLVVSYVGKTLAELRAQGVKLEVYHGNHDQRSHNPDNKIPGRFGPGRQPDQSAHDGSTNPVLNSQEDNMDEFTVAKLGDKWCVLNSEDEVLQEYDTEAEAHSYMGKLCKGKKGNKKEEYSAKEEIENLRKEFAQKQAEIEAAAKKNAEAENERLRADIRKLYAEKRDEKLRAWVKEQKREGKLLPRNEARVFALLQSLPEEGVEVSYFSGEGESRKEYKKSPFSLLQELIEENETGMFKTFSADTGEPSGPTAEDFEESNRGQVRSYEQAQAEVDKRVKEIQSKDKEISYTDAMKKVFQADAHLAYLYNTPVRQ